jgi:hypothetical protein
MDSSQIQAQSPQRDEVDDVLVAFWEWLRLQEARWRAGPDRKEFHFSPSIAAGDSLLDAHRRPAAPRRPSVARRVLRTFIWGFLLTVIVCATFAWQSSDDRAKVWVRDWVINAVAGLRSVVQNEAPAGAGVAVEPVSKPSDASTLRDAALLQAAPPNQSTLAPATELSTELQHQLETMGNDIAGMRRLVERLTARQAQMAQDIATLQAAQQNIIDKISFLSRSPTTPGPPGKNVPRVVHSEATVGSHSTTVPINPTQPRVPLR